MHGSALGEREGSERGTARSRVGESRRKRGCGPDQVGPLVPARRGCLAAMARESSSSQLLELCGRGRDGRSRRVSTKGEGEMAPPRSDSVAKEEAAQGERDTSATARQTGSGGRCGERSRTRPGPRARTSAALSSAHLDLRAQLAPVLAPRNRYRLIRRGRRKGGGEQSRTCLCPRDRAICRSRE